MTAKSWCSIFVAVTGLFAVQHVTKLGQYLKMASIISETILSLIRFIIKFVCYYIWIYTTKRIRTVTIVYSSLMIYTICQVTHNLFLTPVTRPIRDATLVLTGNCVIDICFCILFINICSMIVYYLTWKLIPLKDIKNMHPLRFLLLAILVVESQYLNSSLKSISFSDATQGIQFSIYVIMLQLLLLLCIIYNERHQKALRENTRINLENQAVHSLLESIELQDRNNEQLKQMRHDLKNHLLSLRHLVNSGQNIQALSYIDSISSEVMSFHPMIISGNNILDGILAQKMSIAESNAISFSVSADFSYLSGMSNADICILFGNLLDNALEACGKVEENSRYINLRGHILGETIVFTIENSYDGNAVFLEHFPLTTKKDTLNHGIGTISVSRIVKKYLGTISFAAKEDCFSAVFSFPLPLPTPFDFAD